MRVKQKIRRPKGRLIKLLGLSAPDQGLFNFSVKGVVSPWPEKPELQFLLRGTHSLKSDLQFIQPTTIE